MSRPIAWVERDAARRDMPYMAVWDRILDGSFSDIDALRDAVRVAYHDSMGELLRRKAGIEQKGRAYEYLMCNDKASIRPEHAYKAGNALREATHGIEILRNSESDMFLSISSDEYLNYLLSIGLWASSGRQVYVLAPEVAEAFGNTVPNVPFGELRLPSKAIAIVAKTGTHGCDLLAASDGSGHVTLRSRGKGIVGGSALNDEGFRAMLSLMEADQAWGVRVAMNLMVALSSTKLLSVEDRAPPKPSRRQQDINQGKGLTHKPYRYVYIQGYRQVIPDRSRTDRVASARTHRLHMCSGHWSRYWVREPAAADKPDAVKRNETKSGDTALYRVTRWIEPHWRGVGDRSQESQVVKVKEWMKP